jgi:hypothetical protein
MIGPMRRSSRLHVRGVHGRDDCVVQALHHADRHAVRQKECAPIRCLEVGQALLVRGRERGQA